MMQLSTVPWNTIIHTLSRRLLLTLLPAVGLLGGVMLFPTKADAACDDRYEEYCLTAPISGSATVRPPSSIELSWDYEPAVYTDEGKPIAIQVTRGLAELARYEWDENNPRKSLVDSGLQAGEYVYQACLVYRFVDHGRTYLEQKCSWPFGATIPGAPQPPPPASTKPDRPPAPPTEVHAEILSSSSVRVSWRMPRYVTWIAVERVRHMPTWASVERTLWFPARFDGSEWDPIQRAVVSITDEGLAPLTRYSYTVCATHSRDVRPDLASDGDRVNCGSEGAFLMPPGAPQAPQNVRVTDVNGHAQVAWSNTDDTVITLRVERQLGSEWRDISGPLSQRTTSFADPEPLPGQLLAPRVYRVCAHNVTGRTCSDLASLRSLVADPPTPTMCLTCPPGLKTTLPAAPMPVCLTCRNR